MLGSATAIVQGGVFGIAGVFPPKYTGAVMVGQGIAGLTVNFLRAVCLLILPPDEDLGREDMNSFYGTIIYFALSGVVLLFGCLAMLYLRNMPFALYYINRAKQAQEGGGQRSVVEHSRSEDPPLLNYDTSSVSTYTQVQGLQTPNLSGDHKGRPRKDNKFARVLSRVWGVCALVCYIYIVTFIIFPGVSLHTKLDFLSGLGG